MLTLNTLFFGQMAKHLLDSSKRDIRETFMRSSRPDVFCKKGVLRDFAKFTGKHLFLQNTSGRLFLVHGHFLIYLWLTRKCIISENGQTYFKNLATFDAGSSKCVWQFWSIIYQRVKCEQVFVHWVGMIQFMSDWLSDGSIYVKSFWKNFIVILPFKQ